MQKYQAQNTKLLDISDKNTKKLSIFVTFIKKLDISSLIFLHFFSCALRLVHLSGEMWSDHPMMVVAGNGCKK
jgi:hypothetical protein